MVILAKNEIFTYDNNNRLIKWTNPKIGGFHQNKYDVQGRITENDQVGTIQFGDNCQIVSATGVKLNTNRKQNYPQCPNSGELFITRITILYIFQSKKEMFV